MADYRIYRGNNDNCPAAAAVGVDVHCPIGRMSRMAVVTHDANICYATADEKKYNKLFWNT